MTIENKWKYVSYGVTVACVLATVIANYLKQEPNLGVVAWSILALYWATVATFKE